MKRKHEPKQPHQAPIDVTPTEETPSANDAAQAIASVEDRWGTLIHSYGRQLLIGFGVLLTCIIGITYISSDNRNQMIADYLAAGQLADRISTDTTGKIDKSISKLEELLVRHPELRSRYGSAAAHAVLDGKSSLSSTATQSALELAEEAIVRTFGRTSSSHLSVYRDFAENSLLILERKYEGALQHAQTLAARLPECATETHTLRLFNQVRIAALYRHLGKPQQARETWDTVLAAEDSSSDSYKLIASHLQDGAVSLTDYLEHLE
ncbi:hypothetical protein SCG7086_BJ_00190 [Chlamydiales bacterium SCGC AG-110-P3]|nr:hypothetical protein SCG7086_BJ_00190 [Chlamydiales bacterium SCGC AG-110-P3]